MPVTLVILLALVFVPAASAAHFQRPFEETFGLAAQPSFSSALTVAVDRATGDVLAGDSDERTLSRFHADGTPAPFAALGGNVIDGKEANGKPCSEEPASCDETPQNEINFSFSEEVQIAIDESGGPTDGNIYLTQPNHGLIDIFSSDGKYLGQLTAAGLESFHSAPCGVAVDPSGAVYVAGSELFKYVPSADQPVNADIASRFAMPEPRFCGLGLGIGSSAGRLFASANDNSGKEGVTPRGYQVDKKTGEIEYEFASGFGFSPVAVDPNTGRVLMRNVGRRSEVGEFEVQNESAPVKVSRLVAGSVAAGFAVNDSSEVILSEGFFVPNLKVYGLPGIVPTLTVDPASEIIGTKARLSGTVNPTGLEVTECFFEYGTTTTYGSTAPCEGAIPTDSDPHAVSAELSELEPNGVTYHYRLVAKNANGAEESEDQTFVTAETVETNAATAITLTTATLNGSLRPEELQFNDCLFEYGLTTSAGFESSVPCSQSPGSIPQDFLPHPVSADISGLEAATTYKVRLTATSTGGPFAGTFSGKILTFETQGRPAIREVRGSNADQGSVTLEAKIAPRGFDTKYRFEWGPTVAYGNAAPASSKPGIGGNEAPQRVTAGISGLSAATVYHYRVVAENGQGPTTSEDETFETLNSCGLPEGRCFELVSPRDAGPVAAAGSFAGTAELHFQATSEAGSVAYGVESGFPDATKGAEVLYRGTRGASGWGSTQLSPPILARGETNSAISSSALTMALSDDISCGIVASNQPLTSDARTRLVVEAGGSNLYRRNPSGSYTAITNLTPENLGAVKESFEYVLDGFSNDCGKVAFVTQFHYPGVAGVDAEGGAENGRFYEWDHGTLQSVGFAPGPSGEVAVAAIPGTDKNHSNVVSEDGSRVFFSAPRQISANPEEVGKPAIFVRENGATTRDLSLSETSTADTGATYQYATKNGSRVFFTANAGLTTDSSSEGTDLYEYDLEDEELTDLSVSHEAGGAEVAGFVGSSADGSRVYFVARGQMVPGKGKTFAQNQSDGTYSIYGVSGGVPNYVGTVNGNELATSRGGVTVTSQVTWTSRVSPDGRYLAFETSANVTGYDAGGAKEVYLYDADAEAEATTCISCRPDGLPSVSPPSLSPLAAFEEGYPLTAASTLIETGGNARVFFLSADSLATGAKGGLVTLYEWSHGQVFKIATELPEQADERGAELETPHIAFVGANADGTDLYLASPQTLTWEDGDGRFSVYDARIGGGFPEPAPPPKPCEPGKEGQGSCEGAASPAPPSSATPASSTFSGPGNVKPKPHHKKRHRRHHHSKHKKGHGKHKAGHGKHKKHANGNRGAGK